MVIMISMIFDAERNAAAAGCVVLGGAQSCRGEGNYWAESNKYLFTAQNM